MPNLEARVAVLENIVATQGRLLGEIAIDVRTTRDAVTEARGGWKTLMMLGGASAAFGAFAAKWIPTLFQAMR